MNKVKYFEKTFNTPFGLHTVYCKAVLFGEIWKVHVVYSDVEPYLFTIEVNEEFFKDESIVTIQKSFYTQQLTFLKDYFS
jgi:hypothetical protein